MLVFVTQIMIWATLYNRLMDINKLHTILSWLGTGSINLFGPPFSGKDTQAKQLAELFGGMVVSGGDILRHAKDNAELQRIMAAGDIIPPELFLSIIPPFFAHDDIANKPLFLSSVGRLIEELPVVVAAAKTSGHPIKAVILLDLPESGVWQHFEISQNLHDRGARADDTRESLTKRLDEYAKTKPVLDYYAAEGLLIHIDDTKTPEIVTTEIIDALYERATAAV